MVTHVMNADGTGVTQLTQNDAYDGEPTWAPATPRQPTPSSTPQPLPASTVDIGHGGGVDVALGEGAVWVTTRDALVRVDPTTREVVAEIPMERHGAFRVAAEQGSVWVTVGYEGGVEVVRIDPERNEVVATIPLPEAYDVDIGEGAVWVSASSLVRIDPPASSSGSPQKIGIGRIPSAPKGVGSTPASPCSRSSPSTAP